MTLVFLQKKTTLKVVSGNMAAWFLSKLNVFSTGMLQSKIMQISEIELNRDLFSARAKRSRLRREILAAFCFNRSGKIKEKALHIADIQGFLLFGQISAHPLF